MSGTTSLRAAIENGANWSITVDYAQVTRVGETELVTVGGDNFLAVDFDVEVVW